MAAELLSLRVFAEQALGDYCDGGEMTCTEFLCFRIILAAMTAKTQDEHLWTISETTAEFMRRAMEAVQTPYPTGRMPIEPEVAFSSVREVLAASGLHLNDLAPAELAPLYFQSRFG